MNILPKKRWHVRNKDNKERVRRDEENAALEKKREEERIALAEQEARLSLLRKKNKISETTSKITSSNTGSTDIALQKGENSHINLFIAEEEAGGLLKTGNEDYKLEKQKEKEDYEKKIGLLTYLGQSAIEQKDGAKDETWYLKKKVQKISEEQELSKSAGYCEKDEASKRRLDPLLQVEKSLRKHKDHKKKKKKKEKSSSSQSSSKLSIQELREQRLKREKEEREKANKLLYGQTSEKNEKPPESDPTRYSNQFNPDIARKRKYDHHRY